MNHKNNKRSETTKNKIKTALIEMLQEQELSKITVRALCEKADINRSTFYNHYSSPKGILQGMQNDFLLTVTTYIKSTLETSTEQNSDSIITIMSAIYEYIQDNLQACRVLSNAHLCPELSSALFSDPTIKECLQLSLTEEYPEDAAEFLYQFLFHGTFHTLEYWMQNDCPQSPENVAKLITGILSKF